MNRQQFEKLILDNLELVNKNRTKPNMSKERLIFNSGQRDALTYLLERLQNGNNSN